MKSLLFTLLLCKVILAFRLTITSPNMGTCWRHKKAVWVKWETDGFPDTFDKIDIDLMVGPGSGQLIENISFGVPWEEGKAQWKVAKSLPAGTDYFVQISSPRDKSFKVRSNRFAVCGGKMIGKQNAAGSVIGSWSASAALVIAGFQLLFW